MRRDCLVTALCLLALVVSVQAIAEVRVITDRDGAYQTTRVLLGDRGSGVWSAAAREGNRMALNVMGDRNGDHFPTIAESPVVPFHPWVVWSRLNQSQYDLAWSRWNGGRWEPIRWIAPTDSPPGDDFDADLGFDEIGRPYIAWWRDEGGVGRIYLSTYLGTTWMEAYPVSGLGVDSRYPSIEVLEAGTLILRYDTTDGRAAVHPLGVGLIAYVASLRRPPSELSVETLCRGRIRRHQLVPDETTTGKRIGHRLTS